MKKLLSFLLAAILIISAVPMGAFAFAVGAEANTSDLLISSFEVHNLTIYEGTNCSFAFSDSDGDGVCDEVSYHYYAPDFTVVLDDGTTLNGDFNGNVLYNGKYYSLEYDRTKEWTVGTHTVEASFMGLTDTFTVNILETPIQSIVVDNILIKEGTNCNINYDSENNAWNYYNYLPSIKVMFKDGTTCASSGRTIYYNGQQYDITCVDNQSSKNSWGIGEHAAFLTVMGFSTDFTVEICENLACKDDEHQYANNMDLSCENCDYERPLGEIEKIKSITVEPISFDPCTGGYKASSLYSGYPEDFYLYEWYKESITIEFNDGSIITTSLNNGFEYNGEWYPINHSDNQYISHWTPGNTYTATISILDKTVDVPVTINESPVKSIKVEPVSVEEETGGYWAGYWDSELQQEVKYYYYSYWYNNVKALVEFNDGTSYNTSLGNGVYYNNQYYDFLINTNQSGQQHWIAGNIYTATVSCMGKSTEAIITINENPVDHIELVNPSTYEYIENMDGFFTSRYNDETNENKEYFYYHPQYPYDAVIKIVYKDGTTQLANVGDTVNGHSISWDSNQSIEPWVVGNQNQSTISYWGAEVNMPITVNENPVDHIELVTTSTYEYIENTNGCFSSRFNVETGELEEYFQYYTNYPYDAVIKIVYKDGTTQLANVGDSVNGYDVSWSALPYQMDKPWVVGSDNESTISYMGAKVNMPITVNESPVERIQINTAPTREYVYGDNKYGSISIYDGSYSFSPVDFTGLSFTVYYKDGTQKAFTYKDIDENNVVDGYECIINTINTDKAGEIPVTFSYFGCSVEYTIILNESPVVSFEMIKEPDKTPYKFTHNYTGAQFKITYNDGSSKTITVSDENIEYKMEGPFGTDLNGYVDVEGYILKMFYDWGPGERVASYLGKIINISDSLHYEEALNIIDVKVDNVSKIGLGMTVEVTYEDNTSEILKIDEVLYDFYMSTDRTFSETIAFAKTEKGHFYYHIFTFYMDGEITNYEVGLLGYDIEVEVTMQDTKLGDINGDNDINNRDLALLMQHLNGWEVDIIVEAADVNADGETNNRDYAILMQYVNGWDVELQ